jgi:Na+-driven multidrug efflux pump
MGWHRERQFAPFLIASYTLFSCRTAMIRLQTLRTEIRPTLRLAIPLVLAELGWMSMAIVDTMMVGRLPISISAWLLLPY